MPQWDKRWGIPGGHVEWGESVEQGALREVEEETGLKFDTLEYLGMDEIVEPKDYKKKKHFISFVFRANVVGYPELTLEKREVLEHKWMTLEEASKQKDLCSLMRKSVDRLMLGTNCVSCEGYKAGWQRANADYQNLKNEIDKMRSEWVRLSEQQILEEFIPVYDNFKKAFVIEIIADEQSSSDDKDKKWQNWKIGVGYIMQQFGKVLKDHDVEEIKTIGEVFNPELHEAVSEEEGEETGKILREVESGYLMKGKVIKVAKVIVSK
jgi:molecular chaperone GrpE